MPPMHDFDKTFKHLLIWQETWNLLEAIRIQEEGRLGESMSKVELLHKAVVDLHRRVVKTPAKREG